MSVKSAKALDKERRKIGISTLERYTGSEAADFQPYVLLVNFERYVELFSRISKSRIFEGSVMTSCHWFKEKISIVDYGVGSPTAALIVELLSFIKPKAVVMLGLCGGLRSNQKVGDFFLPVAAIRGEGTSDHFMPPQVPSLSSFTIQRFVAAEVEQRRLKRHTGVIHSTNYRFWEFNRKFKKRLLSEKVQTIDMECATLFTAGFACQVPMGALMLISDKPLEKGGIKTKESSKKVTKNYQQIHVECGISVMKDMQNVPKDKIQYHW